MLLQCRVLAGYWETLTQRDELWHPQKASNLLRFQSYQASMGCDECTDETEAFLHPSILKRRDQINALPSHQVSRDNLGGLLSVFLEVRAVLAAWQGPIQY